MNYSVLISELSNAIKSGQVISSPVNHIVIENFLPEDMAEVLAAEFPDYNSDKWHVYKNTIEDKKTCNQWNLFEGNTYKYFLAINSPEFTNALSEKFSIDLLSDPGLHGGGQHIHGAGGNLNPHLDYSLHPKLNLERRINIIYYLTDNYNEDDGGHFGLWDNSSTEEPGEIITEIAPKFNSAVIFDTSENSWHGLSRTYQPDSAKYRKSLASYYVSIARDTALPHTRAKFAPRNDQKNNEEVLRQIEVRSSEANHKSAYRVE